MPRLISGTLAFVLLLTSGSVCSSQMLGRKFELWPDTPPGPQAQVTGREFDRQKPTDRLVAGKTVMKITNVANAEAHVYTAPPGKSTGAACVICPGGGFSILAWDLEGTEVAEWLNSIGVTAIIVKYRVPTRVHGEPGKWQGPVIDAQRAVSLVRSRSDAWSIDPNKIGILGFSAGGATAARTAVQNGRRIYSPIDKIDQHSCAANFAILIYPGGVVDDEGRLRGDYNITEKTPPMFFAHTADDRTSCENSAELFLALKRAGVAAEMHIYPRGGHGYGLRKTADRVTRWPVNAAHWLRGLGVLPSHSASEICVQDGSQASQSETREAPEGRAAAEHHLLMIAERYRHAWQQKAPLPQLSGLHRHLELSDAYQIQRSWVPRTLGQAGAGGVKAGVVTAAAQKMLDVKEPIGGILRADGAMSARKNLLIKRSNWPGLKIETEIGFILREAITSEVKSVSEFKHLIKAVVPVIELPAGVLDFKTKPSAADVAAVNVAASAYIVGAEKPIEILDEGEVKIKLSRGKQVLHQASSTECWRGPWETGVWLSNFARQQCVDLKPGQLIICGALGKIQTGEAGEYTADYGKLGVIEFRVE